MRLKLDENFNLGLVPLLRDQGHDVDPAQTEGILVVRPPRPLLSEIRATLLTALPHLTPASVKGALHILEPGRIRVYQPGPDTAAAEDD